MAVNTPQLTLELAKIKEAIREIEKILANAERPPPDPYPRPSRPPDKPRGTKRRG